MQLIKVFDIHYVGTFTLPNTFKIFDCFFFIQISQNIYNK